MDEDRSYQPLVEETMQQTIQTYNFEQALKNAGGFGKRT